MSGINVENHLISVVANAGESGSIIDFCWSINGDELAFAIKDRLNIYKFKENKASLGYKFSAKILAVCYITDVDLHILVSTSSQKLIAFSTVTGMKHEIEIKHIQGYINKIIFDPQR